MNAKELIRFLQTSGANLEKEISIFYDGDERSFIEGVVETKTSLVLVADFSIYNDNDEFDRFKESKILYKIN